MKWLWRNRPGLPDGPIPLFSHPDSQALSSGRTDDLQKGAMTLRYYIVDVFAERRYAGNQLAVVLDAEALSDTAMQAIAREMHLSETAVVRSP